MYRDKKIVNLYMFNILLGLIAAEQSVCDLCY